MPDTTGEARARQSLPYRACAALALLALLAACSSPNHSSSRVAQTSGRYARPASYDPPGPPGDPWGPWIVEAAQRFDIPERWIREVMRQESGGRVSAVSSAGAMGLMQLMPGTYAEMQARYGLGSDPYHPYDNLMAGTAYLREMYNLYGSPAFLAAYNAGPRRLEGYLWGGNTLPGETRNYVARIGPRIAGHHPVRRAPPEVYAAAEIPLNIPPGPRQVDRRTMLALREQREAVQPGITPQSLPAGPVVAMEPVPDGSTPEGAARLAGIIPSALAVETLPPPVQLAGPAVYARPGGVVSMAPIADGSTPAGAARLAEANARLQEPPRAPEPAPRHFAAAAAVPPSPTRGFSLMPFGRAEAAPLPAGRIPTAAAAPATGNWGVQVGAFASENLARTAANQARDVLGAGARVVVQPVQQGGSRLYRARVTGLSQASARQACDRLRVRGACMVLSPDVQS